jgi:hypothetical protein
MMSAEKLAAEPASDICRGSSDTYNISMSATAAVQAACTLPIKQSTADQHAA